MRSQALLIANPKAGAGAEKKIVYAQKLLLQKGIESQLYLTSKRGDAEVRARQGVIEKRPMIITAGGDGTINEAINGMALCDVPLGIIPLGTTNVLAIEIGSDSIEKAVLNIANGSPKNVSLGRIALDKQKTVWFILMAGIGFDGNAVYGMNEKIKKISGKGAYILSGINSFFRFTNQTIFIVDGIKYQGYSGIISNACHYGGRFKIAPDANIESPDLYINIFKGKGKINLSRYLFGIITGRHTKYNDVEYLKCKGVRVEGTDLIQIDGDYLGAGDCYVEVVTSAIRIIYR
jgi:YegS/Rv2252/BmrU family lipid kinase